MEDAALALSNAELIFFTTILWKLWCFLNDAIHGNRRVLIPALVQEAANLAKFSTFGRDGGSSRAHSTPQLWKEPAFGQAKVNFAIFRPK